MTFISSELLNSTAMRQAAAEYHGERDGRQRQHAPPCSGNPPETEALRDNGDNRGAPPDEQQKTKAIVQLLRGVDVKIEPIRFIWDGWLARGKMHVIGGAPGAGKTTIALSFTATATREGKWPDGSRCEQAGNVIIWSGEDDPADTLAPRLIAMGADMQRVYFVDGVAERGKARAFDPAKDIDALSLKIKEIGGASLIIVDPIVSAIAGDSHKNAETRRGLQPLVDLARSQDAALIGVTHFSKGTAGRQPLERVTGSLAFGALARVVMVASKSDAEDGPPRILARAKSNIGPDDGGFGYDLEQRPLPDRDDICAQAVAWGEALDGSALELLAKAEGVTERETEGGRLQDAEAFLKATLSYGPMAAKKVLEEAQSAGLTEKTVRRAKKALGIVDRREGYGASGRFIWSLPDNKQEGA